MRARRVDANSQDLYQAARAMGLRVRGSPRAIGVGKSCEVCGQHYRVQRTRAAGSHACSRACIGELYRRRMASGAMPLPAGRPPVPKVLKPELACKMCGKPAGYSRQRNPRAYCSTVCRGRAVGLDGSRRIRNPKSKKDCALCGKPFETYHRHHRFCSRACSDKGQPTKRGGRKDANHDEIVACLLARGFLVFDCHLKGHGYPDLTVQKGGVTYLVEIKSPKWRHQRRLTPHQVEFMKEFDVHIVHTEGDVERLSQLQTEHMLSRGMA